MLANILDQVIKTYGKEFLGDWDPINNFRSGPALRSSRVQLRNAKESTLTNQRDRPLKNQRV